MHLYHYVLCVRFPSVPFSSLIFVQDIIIVMFVLLHVCTTSLSNNRSLKILFCNFNNWLSEKLQAFQISMFLSKQLGIIRKNEVKSSVWFFSKFLLDWIRICLNRAIAKTLDDAESANMPIGNGNFSLFPLYQPMGNKYSITEYLAQSNHSARVLTYK